MSCGSTQPIRAGILGLGQRGLEHLRALWRLQQGGLVRVTALADAWEENVAPAKIAGYVRFALGEGIEKEESDFAAEVAAAAKG